MKPILDATFSGLLTIVIMLLVIGVIKGLATKAKKPQTNKRPNRRAGHPSSRREASTSGRSVQSLSSESYGVDSVPPVTPERRSQLATMSMPEPLVWNIDLLRQLEWKRFEELCAQFWTRKGYPARLSGPGADGGIDVVIADQRDPTKFFAVAQCKAWASKPVGVEPVRALWGAKDHFKANLALLYGLSGFTPDARSFAEGKHLKLISGEELLQQILSMPAVDQAALLAEITQGDYTTPTCPNCDIKMERHPGKGGKPDFWGCRHFRRCGARTIACRS